MKTNIPIELDDAARSLIADMIDGKRTARLAKRKELIALAQQFFGGILGQLDEDHAGRINEDLATPPELNQLYTIAPEDSAFLQGKPAGFVRGWNLVKKDGKPIRVSSPAELRRA